MAHSCSRVVGTLNINVLTAKNYNVFNNIAATGVRSVVDLLLLETTRLLHRPRTVHICFGSSSCSNNAMIALPYSSTNWTHSALRVSGIRLHTFSRAWMISVCSQQALSSVLVSLTWPCPAHKGRGRGCDIKNKLIYFGKLRCTRQCGRL